MERLLLLLAVACVCLGSAVAHAGNAHPALYLEIYSFVQDPVDPGPAPSHLCVHPQGSGELACYSPKAPYTFGIVPIHVDRLDTPIAQGWPLPCGPGGGYVGVTLGVAMTGVVCTYLSFEVCPEYLQGPSTPPVSIVLCATTKCHDWPDHPGYLRYINSGTDTGATYFDIVNNPDDGYFAVINCRGTAEYGATVVGGRAQWGGSKTVSCYSRPIAVESTTWGNIKAIYR
jgi:hypothetical protein